MGRWNREGASSYGSKAYAVRLVDEKDKEVSLHYPTESTWAFDKLSAKYQVLRAKDKTEIDTIVVPAEQALFSTRLRVAPLACAFHATKGVLKNLFGVELSSEDEDWFLNHGLLEPGGLPMPHTLRVIQGLISPYNFRIARVRITPGFTLKGNLLEWRPLLGMNPMALADRGTTNAEYAEATGEPLEQVNNLYRMEYNATPFTAGVVCEASDGNACGHASYAAPRRKASGREWMSYQLSRTSSDPWTLEEPTWEYIQAPEEAFLDVWAMIRVEEKSAFMGEPPAQPRLALEEPPAKEGGTKLLAFKNSGTCCMCGKGEVSTKEPICGECWTIIWDGYSCPDKYCGAELYKRPPKFLSADLGQGTLHTECRRCNEPIEIHAATDEGVQMALRAIAGRFTKQDRENWEFYAQMQAAGAGVM